MAQTAVNTCEDDLQTAGERSDTLNASIQEEQTRVAELEIQVPNKSSRGPNTGSERSSSFGTIKSNAQQKLKRSIC